MNVDYIKGTLDGYNTIATDTEKVGYDITPRVTEKGKILNTIEVKHVTTLNTFLAVKLVALLQAIPAQHYFRFEAESNLIIYVIEDFEF